MNYSPSIAAACAFPPSQGYNGASTTIRDLDRLGFSHNVFVTTARDAVRLVTEANLALGTSYGHGNRARRRRAHR